jgi:hypothetical protein
VTAAQLVPILKPMITLPGQLRADNPNLLDVIRMIRVIRRIDQVAVDAPTIVPDPRQHPEQPASDAHLTRVVPVSDMRLKQRQARLRPSGAVAAYPPLGLPSLHNGERSLHQLHQNRGQTNWTLAFATEAHVTVRFGHDPQDPTFDRAQIAEELQALACPRGAHRTRAEAAALKAPGSA